MTLLASEHTLEHITLRILGSKPGLSAETIRLAASQGSRTFSRAAVYKVLGRLLDSGVVVRSGPRYSLSLSWIFDFLTLADQLSKTYFSDYYIRTLIPPPGKRLSWNFNDLIRCNEFWNQLLLALLKHTSVRRVFSWVPYPWFILLRDDREARLQEVFKVSGRSFYTSFGPCGAFEDVVEGIYTHKNQVISFAKSPFSQLKDSYIDLIGDYILTVSLSPETAKRVQGIFSSQGRRPVVLGRQLAALSQRCSAKVTLECNQRKSRRHRAAFGEFFGVTE